MLDVDSTASRHRAPVTGDEQTKSRHAGNGFQGRLQLWAESHWLRSRPWSFGLRRYPLVWAALALMLGGVVVLRYPSFFESSLLPYGLAAVLVAWACLLRRYPAWMSSLGLFALVCLGVAHAVGSRPLPPDAFAESAKRRAQPVAVRCVVLSSPTWRPNGNYRPEQPGSNPWKTSWDVQVREVRNGLRWEQVQSNAIFHAEGRIDHFIPGDEIELYGSYRRIIPPTNPGGFDYAHHAAQKSQYVILSVETPEQIQLIHTSWRWWPQRIRALVVRTVDRTLRHYVAWDQSSLAAALVFGQREQVDWNQQQQLMATGTLHMLAISGMHVEIVASSVLLLCMALSVSRTKRMLLVISICLLYAALAEGKPPVVRAVVLVSAMEIANWLGRRQHLGNLLGFAAMVLFVSHFANIQNIGVYLSFLAVATIAVFVPSPADANEDAIKRWLGESSGPWSYTLRFLQRSSWQVLRLSFWVWLVTCPIVWSHFHVVAPISVPLNVLIAVPLAISLLAGLITGVLGWLAPVAWFTGQIAGGGLQLIVVLIGWGTRIPGGHFWLPSPSFEWAAMFYVMLGGWLLMFGTKLRGWLALVLLAWLAIGVAAALRGGLRDTDDRAAEELRCTFLDVGHGTSVILELPDGSVWLYDAGHLGSTERSHQEIADALWDRGISTIDKVILSHADADHYNALPGLLQRFRIRSICSTEQFWSSRDRDVTSLLQQIAIQGVERTTWAAGTAGTVEGVSWRVLHPTRRMESKNDNDASLCLLLEHQGRRIFLPGDIEDGGLTSMALLPPRACDLLMAPHHGSLTVDASPLLEWCLPTEVVISGNHRAARDAVLHRYSQRGARVSVTFRDGAIQYRINRRGAALYRWSDGGWMVTQTM